MSGPGTHLSRWRSRRHSGRNARASGAAGRIEQEMTEKGLLSMTAPKQPLRVGVGGPVGSGKTALMEQRAKRLRDTLEIAAITNDIYTKEDARIPVEAGALPAERIMGVETGAARTPRSARTPRLTSRLSLRCGSASRTSTSSSSNWAATISPPLLARTGRFDDLRHRRVGGEKIRGRAGPGSPARTCSSSTRSTSPLMSAPRSRSWRATPPPSARGDPSSWPT